MGETNGKPLRGRREWMNTVENRRKQEIRKVQEVTRGNKKLKSWKKIPTKKRPTSIKKQPFELQSLFKIRNSQTG